MKFRTIKLCFYKKEMRKLNINKKEGVLFWITGLAGSGKSSIARYLLPKIQKYYGPSIIVSGDNLRNITVLENIQKKID